MKKLSALLLTTAVACAFTGQAVASPFDSLFGKNSHAEKEFFAMDTVMSVSVNGKNAEEAADAVVDEVNRLDRLLSTGNKDSEVSAINENGGGTLGEDGRALMKKALSLYEDSEGLYDISIYPVMELWGFASSEAGASSDEPADGGAGESGRDSDESGGSSEKSSEAGSGESGHDLDEFRVPSEEEIDETLDLVDASKIIFDEETGEVSFDMDGMKIDFGGIAKGYTSSRMMEILREHGIESALVNLGGNVQALGTKPDGSKWRVGVQDPGDNSGLLGILEIEDLAVITSGGYERYFEENGQVYHHIIDPRTGFPADTGLTSVTIVSPDGTLADGLSTFLYIAGEEQAETYWRAHADEFDMILAKEDGTLLVTEGIENVFSSEYDYEVIYL